MGIRVDYQPAMLGAAFVAGRNKANKERQKYFLDMLLKGSQGGYGRNVGRDRLGRRNAPALEAQKGRWVDPLDAITDRVEKNARISKRDRQIRLGKRPDDAMTWVPAPTKDELAEAKLTKQREYDEGQARIKAIKGRYGEMPTLPPWADGDERRDFAKARKRLQRLLESNETNYDDEATLEQIRDAHAEMERIAGKVSLRPDPIKQAALDEKAANERKETDKNRVAADKEKTSRAEKIRNRIFDLQQKQAELEENPPLNSEGEPKSTEKQRGVIGKQIEKLEAQAAELEATTSEADTLYDEKAAAMPSAETSAPTPLPGDAIGAGMSGASAPEAPKGAASLDLTGNTPDVDMPGETRADRHAAKIRKTLDFFRQQKERMGDRLSPEQAARIDAKMAEMEEKLRGMGGGGAAVVDVGRPSTPEELADIARRSGPDGVARPGGTGRAVPEGGGATPSGAPSAAPPESVFPEPPKVKRPDFRTEGSPAVGGVAGPTTGVTPDEVMKANPGMSRTDAEDRAWGGTTRGRDFILPRAALQQPPEEAIKTIMSVNPGMSAEKAGKVYLAHGGGRQIETTPDFGGASSSAPQGGGLPPGAVTLANGDVLYQGRVYRRRKK